MHFPHSFARALQAFVFMLMTVERAYDKRLHGSRRANEIMLMRSTTKEWWGEDRYNEMKEIKQLKNYYVLCNCSKLSNYRIYYIP